MNCTGQCTPVSYALQYTIISAIQMLMPTQQSGGQDGADWHDLVICSAGQYALDWSMAGQCALLREGGKLQWQLWKMWRR